MKNGFNDRDDIVIQYLYKQGFRISAQDINETRLNRENSKITILIKK